MPGGLRDTPEGAMLEVRASPRSSRQGVEAFDGAVVKVRVRSAPVDGKANKELAEVLSDFFGIPKSAVAIKSGEGSRTKRVLLRGATASAVRERVP